MPRVLPPSVALLCCALLAAPSIALGQEPIVRASVPDGGGEANLDAAAGRLGAISADGRYVAFNSSATNLVAGDTNGFGDTFVRDLTPPGPCA
jgi:hypothetical protein